MGLRGARIPTSIAAFFFEIIDTVLLYTGAMVVDRLKIRQTGGSNRVRQNFLLPTSKIFHPVPAYKIYSDFFVV